MGGGGRKHWGSLRKNFKYFYLMKEKSWIEREEKRNTWHVDMKKKRKEMRNGECKVRLKFAQLTKEIRGGRKIRCVKKCLANKEQTG